MPGRSPWSSSVEAQAMQRQPRNSLPDDQDRLTFAINASPQASAYGHVVDPIGPSEGEQNLFYLEGESLMPYSPAAYRNLEIVKIRSSVDVPARMRFYVDTNQVFSVFLKGGGYQDVQQAGGFELVELVDTLDGSHDLKVTVENLDDSANLEGTVFFRAIEEDI